jgi:Zn-dependent metalloprotease
MAYGDGDGVIFAKFTLLDINGHEDGHQVTKETCNLTYQGQPGALNEHLSDVDGVTCRQYILGLSAESDSWLIGPAMFAPGISGRALRDMLNPGTAYNDPRLGKDPQPAHMSKFLETEQDSGGVHINSGIPNKAYAMFATAIGGNVWDSAYQVWWKTRRSINSECDFQTFANTTLSVCKQMRPQDTQKLIDAWKSVGIDAK